MKPKSKIAFFGGEPLGPASLRALIAADLAPALVFCNPDRPRGRGHTLQAPTLKVLATEHHIPVNQPSSFKDRENFSVLTEEVWDMFIVVAYNFILPSWLLALPQHGVVNVHPSLLPKLRGASPIRAALWQNKPEEVGVTIMLMDEKMDHGPIIAQAPYDVSAWPISGPDLDNALAKAGANLLTATIPAWLEGTLTPRPQAHELATYTKKITKDQGELFINPHALPHGSEATETYFKILALAGNPGTFFWYQNKRVKVIEAILTTEGRLELQKVVPEGKSETTFTAYLQSLANH